MEFTAVVARRRMIRRYLEDPMRPEVLERVVRAGTRGPSAGFSQGVDLVVLEREDRELFWRAAAPTVSSPHPADHSPDDPPRQADTAPDAWLRGMQQAPALVLVVASRDAYLDRYTEPDKGWTDRDEAHWPIPFWHVDAGMAGMLILLAAVDEGLGACFFGVPAARHDAVREAFSIPADRFLVGVISLGHPAPTQPGGSGTTRPRRPTDTVIHQGRW